MAWVYLSIAGGLEIAWAAGLKKLSFNFTWTMGALTVFAMFASLAALYATMVKLPLGIAYPIWTGIGSVGSVLISVVFFHQNLSLASVVGLILLISGMLLLGLDAQ